jgi:hypothetical protein
VENRGTGDIEDVPDYEKFTTTQKEFWDTCTSSFTFGQQSLPVDIAQYQPTKDEHIIEKLKTKIMKSVKAELLQVGGINQQQKICLIPVDEQENLLSAKPKESKD